MLNKSKSLCVLTFTALLVCLSWLNSGCKPAVQPEGEQQVQAPEQVQPDEDQIKLVEDTLQQIYQLESEQKIEDALALVEASLNNKDFSTYKMHFFQRKIELLLMQEKDTEAEKLILKEQETTPESANTFGLLFGYYNNRKEFDKSIALSDRLIKAKDSLSIGMLSNILNSKMAATIELDDMPQTKAVFDEVCTLVNQKSTALNIIRTGLSSLIQKKNFTAANEIAVYLQSSNPGEETYKNLVAEINLQCIVIPQKWDQLKPAFENCIQQLPDQQLKGIMSYTFRTLNKAKMTDLLKECARIGFSSAAGKSNSCDFAASQWVNACFDEDRNSLPDRLRDLEKTTVSPNQIASIFNRHFYDVSQEPALIKELCRIGPKLIERCTDEKISNSLKLKILDGAFIIEDYDLAISMLEDGIPGKDETWHTMTIPKIKAHRAQSAGKPLEAVRYFREFMKCLSKSEEEAQSDPTTGIIYSKALILGRNANRIADILQALPDQADAAAKARDEARAYFKEAIEQAKNDEATLKFVTEEAAKIK